MARCTGAGHCKRREHGESEKLVAWGDREGCEAEVGNRAQARGRSGASTELFRL